ncbi:hypothetical protein TWF569_005736 [Orbilia oligospora]|uniref:Uncharacterized protein n=1 Tax=Orbilia oligospora TaxID=2813651 RepID=A0A7C8J039_ORBOL|nr:hypothetical protein TWF102_002800 [Orbilia oligospora]KAF3108086.1 hypothetical protein TWF103_005645 [Orbilia oligospora]KAF3148392.1 hypothetical protein TWF569_005736 [Orbilia oligospora]
MALHRRISLSDLESPEAPVSAQPTHHLPPKYFEYKRGGRDEFFRDLEAYQAAAQIHAQHHQATAASPTIGSDEHEAPSYDSIGEALPTIHETKVFKKRLLSTLREIREFTEKRRNTPKWSNCFGLTQNVRLMLAAILILCMVGGIVAMAITFRQVAGLGKVERFEKMEEETLKRIKKGVDATLNPMFWIESERRMEEAIPEELRIQGDIQQPPPAHFPVEHLPPPNTSPAAPTEPAGEHTTRRAE